MGSLDSNGIYQYDSNDQVAPLATLLNLGQSATSAALVQTKEDVLLEMNSLPVPVTATGASSNTITAHSWANLPGGNVLVTMTLAKPAWVELTANCVAVVPHNGDLRVAIDVYGATTIGPDSPTPASGGWFHNKSGGEIIEAREFSKKARLNAGVNNIRIRAQIAAGSQTCKVEYPYIQVSPFRWVSA